MTESRPPRPLASLVVGVMLGGSLAPGLATDVFASVVPSSQDRFVSASACADDPPATSEDSDIRTAADFGPFVDSVTASADVGTASAAGSATQDSEILPAGMSASGSVTAAAQGSGFQAFGLSDTESRFEVTFDVTTPASWALTGSLAAFESGFALARLTGPGGTIALVAATSDGTVPVAESGSLAPGTFTLLVRANGTAFGDFFSSDSAFASYQVDLVIDPVTGTPQTGGPRTRPQSGLGLFARPNPFREATVIVLETASPGAATPAGSRGLVILDVRGRLVRAIPPGGSAAAGVTWDGRDGAGNPVVPGVYFVRLDSSRGNAGAEGSAAGTRVVRLR